MSKESRIIKAGPHGTQATITDYECFGWEVLSINGADIIMSRETQNPVYAELVKAQASTSDIHELSVGRKTLERLIRERAEITPFVYKTEGGHDVVRFEYGDGPETILLVGHYDTVHPAGTMEWPVEEQNAMLFQTRLHSG